MSAFREAVLLPALFLTVALLGSLRPGAPVAAPSPFSLVIATMIVAALVRSRALAPERLLNPSRAILANANGIVVLATLFAAAAQLTGLLTPDRGVPRFFVSLFLFVLLLNTMVALPDRVRVLRSLGVVLLAVFMVKFVVLAAVSEPAASRTGRVIAILFDAATLGSVLQDPHPPSAAYLAFGGIVLFLAGTVLLPRADPDAGSGIVVARRYGEDDVLVRRTERPTRPS